MTCGAWGCCSKLTRMLQNVSQWWKDWSTLMLSLCLWSSLGTMASSSSLQGKHIALGILGVWDMLLLLLLQCGSQCIYAFITLWNFNAFRFKHYIAILYCMLFKGSFLYKKNKSIRVYSNYHQIHLWGSCLGSGEAKHDNNCILSQPAESWTHFHELYFPDAGVIKIVHAKGKGKKG